MSNGYWQNKAIDKLDVSDKILIRNEEIIPCDGVLVHGKAKIDYSFVSGESNSVNVSVGDSVSAGGKQLGGAIEIEVCEKVDQSKLTDLWNDDVFNKRDAEKESVILNIIGKYFTIIILFIAAATLTYWVKVDADLAINNFTAVLIIACPCVLALSVPFIYGNALRILSKSQIYCKNVFTLFDLDDIDTIVFDKTGTITDSEKLKAEYHGKNLSQEEKNAVKSLCFYSNHVLSKSIVNSLDGAGMIDVKNFVETPGQGIEGNWKGNKLRIGSSKFVLESEETTKSQTVFIEINGMVKGHFTFENPLRKNINFIINDLSAKYTLAVLSGDNSEEKRQVKSLFPDKAEIYFNQSPKEKLNYINRLQQLGKKVMMVGDGLNDAGALKMSDVGVVLSSEENNFTPASDIIISAKSFTRLASFMQYARRLKDALYGAFVIALLYNSIGLGFAVSGHLTPIVAAILMPFSSLSIMAYGLIMSNVLLQKDQK